MMCVIYAWAERLVLFLVLHCIHSIFIPLSYNLTLFKPILFLSFPEPHSNERTHVQIPRVLLLSLLSIYFTHFPSFYTSAL